MNELSMRKNESGVNFIIRSRIREERKKLNLHQAYMAYELDRTLVAYNRLENGRIHISVDDLVAIANILGIAVVNLMPPDPNAKSNWTPGQWHILNAYEEGKQMDAQSATPQPTQPKTRSSTKRRKTKTR
jgi:transcriptional regulator with XRE-family HTH domain